jgi:DNA mismatch repair protein MutL
MARVAVLSESLINKIAAGEVVERPASAVKELVENALDAGAKVVRVGLAGGGLDLVSVTDDGSGMSREDAVLSLSRHATSKLRDLDGLFCIRTLGFRGEALPAIASVSRFSLITSEPGAQMGTRLEVTGGAAVHAEDAPAVSGTRVRAEDLFFNTPARRKFMRAQATELRHCEEAVIRAALARPDVAFHVEHDARPLFSSSPCAGDLRERIAQAFGPEIHRHLIEVEERMLGVSVRGFIASPEYHLANARGVYTYVNGRYIRDRALNASIQRAFSDVLPGGRQPALVLFIELDPREVDMNVHPQKLEVRFQDARGVSEAVFRAMARGLKAGRAAPPSPDDAGVVGTAQYALAVERFLSRAQTFAGDGLRPFASDQGAFARADLHRAPAFGEARPDLNQAAPPGYFSSLRWIGPLARRFWLFEGPGGSLVVVDPHAAAERVRLIECQRRVAASPPPGGAQAALFGVTVELPAPEARLLGRGSAALQALGVEVEQFGGNAFAVRALPPGLEGANARQLLIELAPLLPAEAHPAANGRIPDALDPAAQVLACHAALGFGVEASAEARAALMAALDEGEFRGNCRHGQIVVADVPLLDLERRARRLARDERS